MIVLLLKSCPIVELSFQFNFFVFSTENKLALKKYLYSNKNKTLKDIETNHLKQYDQYMNY